MSPRTRRSKASVQAPNTHHTRASRKPSVGQHSSSPDQRPRVTGPSKTPKTSITTRGQRRVRANSGPQKSNSSEESDAGDNGADKMNEDDDNSDNLDEPEAFAPSGPVTRKRGHQTGLSVTLSKTNLGPVQAGTKRELSVSTVDSETKGRPRKMSKLGQRPSLKQAKEQEDDPSAWDSDYGAVDDISESDQGLSDSDMERQEEQQIIQSIEHETDGRSKRGRSVDSWADFRFDTPPVDDESQFFSEHFALTEPNSEHDTPGGRNARHGRTPTSDPAPVRRVRFADIESSTSASTSSRNSEGDDFTFPDLLFEDQDHQAARAVVSLVSPEEDPGQYSDGSYWELDVSEPIGAVKTKIQRARTPHHRSSSDSSGYETDTSEGETTDEDPIPPQTVNRPQANLRLVTDSSATKRIFRKNAIPRPQSHSRRGKGPCLGTWIADPAKPIGIVDHKTKKMFYVKPAPPLPKADSDSKENESPQQGSNGNQALDEDASDSSAQNGELSMQTQSTDVMFSGFMSDITAGDLPSAGIMGPPEAFFAYEEFEFETQDDDEDPENQLDITDFIDFGEGSSDSNEDVENEPESEELTSPVTPLSSQKLPTIRPKQSKDRTSSQSLLSHFDKGIVSAFRRNQHRHQSVLRRPAIGSKSLAIKGGRQQAASSPISPARKRRADSGLDQSVSLFTGLNGTRMRMGTL